MICLSRSSRNSLINVPGRLNVSAKTQVLRSRRFHASPPNRLINEALQLSHDIFQAVHLYSHLPWALSIPLTGILFRLSFVPVQYLANRGQRSVQQYTPLLIAWRTNLRVQAQRKFRDQTQTGAKQAEVWVIKQLEKRQNEFGKRYGHPRKFRNILMTLGFLPVWLVNMDVLRRMAGQENSLLGNFADSKIVPPELSFVSEGALWFPDLTMADPIWVLPLAFGAAQFANWYFAIGKGYGKRRAEADKMSPGMERTKRRLTLTMDEMVMMLALLSPPFLIQAHVPSGVVLYLVASAATMLLQRPVMKKAMGLTRMITPANALAPRLKK